MSEPEPAPEPKLFESQSRSRNKKFQLHNAALTLTRVSGDAARLHGLFQLFEAVEDKGQSLPLDAQSVGLVVTYICVVHMLR